MTNKALKWSLMAVVMLSVLFPAGAYLGVVLVLFLAIKARKSRQMVAELSADTAALIMLFCVLLSMIYSEDKLLSIAGTAVIFLNVGLYLALAVELKNIELQGYCQWLNTACLLACAYGIYQFASGNLSLQKSWVDEESFGVLARIYSTMHNPNIFAAYLAVNLSFGLASFKSIKEDMLLLTNIILASVCLLLTYSRGGFAAFFTAMLVLCLLKEEKRGVAIYLAAMSAAFAAVNSTTHANRAGLAAIYHDSSNLYRFEIWKAALNMFLANPVFGHGIGTTWYYLSSGSDKLFRYILHSHNIYLQVAAEMGTAGLAAFTGLIAKKVWEGCRLLKEQSLEGDAHTIQGFIACTAGIAVHGLVDAVLFVPAMSLAFIGYFALYGRVLSEHRAELSGYAEMSGLQRLGATMSFNGKGVFQLSGSKGPCEDKYKNKEGKAYQA